MILIASYPKSGSTYLTRLLGDILNCPTGGCIPEEDAIDPAAEGQDRPGSCLVRRGHFVLVDNKTGLAIPEPHKLAYRRLANEKVIFLVRDPRGICISGAYHWQVSPAEFLEQMIVGEVAGCGRWDEYCGAWLDWEQAEILRYRDISEQKIKRLLRNLGVSHRPGRIRPAFRRQSFEARVAGLDEEGMRRNNMRKGIVGDWRNHFTPGMNDRIWREFGPIMERFGYER